MKVLGLISGGKDSCYNLILCQQYGHEIVALGNLHPPPSTPEDDLNSWMFQTVGHDLIEAYSRCTGLPLYRTPITGSPLNLALNYTSTTGDEVEDLFRLISFVKSEIPDLGGVSCGAIGSDYQRLRVEQICSRLGLISLAFLWRQDQFTLLESVTSHLSSILIKVAVLGLNPDLHLGRSLIEVKNELFELSEKFGVSVCGEGGEFETFVLDCSLFKFAFIKIDEFEVLRESENVDFNPVGILKIKTFHLEPKKDSSFIPEAQIIQIPDSCDLTLSHTFPRVDKNEPKGLELKFRQALESMRKSLESDSHSLENVVFISLFLRNMSDFEVINGVYQELLPSLNPPSRACIGLKLPEGEFKLHWMVDKRPKEVLHVQSWSCWAPSCVGPYSQATSIGNLSIIAGVIGLVPQKMNFEDLNLIQELELALQHCQSIAIAIGADMEASALRVEVYLSESTFRKLTRMVEGEIKALLEFYWPNCVWWNGRRVQSVRKRCVVRDSNLRPKTFDVTVAPLVTFVVVSELPKCARFEIQPIVLNAKSTSRTNTQKVSPGILDLELRSKLDVSKVLNLEIRQSSALIGGSGAFVKPLVDVLDCGGLCGFVRICFPELEGDENQRASLASSCVQWLHDWLKDSIYEVEHLQSSVMWYTDSRLYEFLKKVDKQLEWKESMILPAYALGADLTLCANAIIEIWFAIN